jgi:hypothetical protein
MHELSIVFQRREQSTVAWQNAIFPKKLVTRAHVCCDVAQSLLRALARAPEHLLQDDTLFGAHSRVLVEGK